MKLKYLIFPMIFLSLVTIQFIPGSGGTTTPFGDDQNPNPYYDLYVQGRVTTINGVGIGNVLVVVSTDTGFIKSDYTDSQGNYNIQFNEQGFYFNEFIVGAVKTGYDVATVTGNTNDYIHYDIAIILVPSGIGWV